MTRRWPGGEATPPTMRVYHRETIHGMVHGLCWTMVHHRLGLVWYTRKASLCTAARPGKPPPRDRIAYNPSSLAPPLPFTPSPTASAFFLLSPSSSIRFSSSSASRPPTHARRACIHGRWSRGAALPVNREGALGEKALIDDIARKLGGTTLLTTLENSLTPGEK